MATPYATVALPSAASTQDEAGARYDGTPVLVVAERQTAGRGRSGRPWWQAPRALFASLAFAPGWEPAALPRVGLVAALAARDALAAGEPAPPPPFLKWPNDLVDRRGRKVGGVLAERAGTDPVVVVGIGINLWWPEAPEGVAAAFEEDPGPRRGPAIAARWATRLLERAGDATAWGRDEYRRACVTLGEVVTWHPDGRGRAVDVSAAGGLVVETADGRTEILAGEVTHVRTASLQDRSERSEEGRT